MSTLYVFHSHSTMYTTLSPLRNVMFIIAIAHAQIRCTWYILHAQFAREKVAKREMTAAVDLLQSEDWSVLAGCQVRYVSILPFIGRSGESSDDP